MEDKVADFVDTLTVDERSILKNALSHQIESFFDSENSLVINTIEEEMKFRYLTSALRHLTKSTKPIPNNGIIYYGKPRWINAELLSSLIDEAESRRLKPLDQIDHFLGCGGAHADRLAESLELLDFIKEIAGPVKQTGIASYIYYDQPGLGIRPHVDTDVFSINLILMLRHDMPIRGVASSTVVFPSNQSAEYYRLQIGEVLIMFGGSVIHTRTKIKEGEIVHILTIGFNPVYT